MKTTALILAGGRASRMNGEAKCLLPLGDGRSILEHLVEALTRAKLDIVVLGDLPPDEVAAWEGSEVVFLPDAERFGGTARAVAGAEKFLNHRKSDSLLVCYGDTFLPGFDYASACYPDTITIGRADEGNVDISEDGAEYFHYASSPVDGWHGWLELGATCVRFSSLAEIGKHRDLPSWLSTWTFPRVCIHSGLVIGTGTPELYEHARSWTP